MKTVIDYKKVVIWSVIVLVIQMIVGNWVYMNPVVSGIFEQFKGHSSMKPMDAF